MSKNVFSKSLFLVRLESNRQTISNVSNQATSGWTPSWKRDGKVRWSRLEAEAQMQLWRSHPVIFAALIGALTGLANAAVLMFGVGYIAVATNRVLLILWPTSILGVGFLDGPRAFEAFLCAAELGSNALLYALVFSIPVGLIAAVRRSFGKSEEPISMAWISTDSASS